MSLLFSPFSLAGLTLRNRVVMPPMATALEGPGGSREDNGLPSQATIEYYRQRAKNGVGMVIVEHTYIAKDGKAHKGQLGIDNDDAIPYFAELAGALRENGAVAAVQLNHAGAAANPQITGCQPLGPCDRPNPRSSYKPRAMTIEDIHRVQDLFAQAALRVKKAGFDAVELHSAHGYLGTQFLSPLTNAREDEYGGSLENRARFIVETVEKVKEKVGPDFPVFVRLGTTDEDFSLKYASSPASGTQAQSFGEPGPKSTSSSSPVAESPGASPGSGFRPEDAVEVAKMLQDAGVALIDVSGGFSGSRPVGAPPGYFVGNASLIKRKVNIPVLVTGGITDAHFAEKILEDGHADLIGVGRAILRDPSWVLKARNSLEG